MTEWKPIEWTRHLYEVSDEGQVRRVPGVVICKNGMRKTVKGGIQTTVINNRGYKSVELSVLGKVYQRMVHCLVLEAFVGPRPESMQPRHMNGQSLDNRVGNLAWGTASQNILDTVSHGTHAKARNTHCVAGHEYTEQNTYGYGTNHRKCRECGRLRAAAKRSLTRSG